MLIWLKLWLFFDDEQVSDFIIGDQINQIQNVTVINLQFFHCDLEKSACGSVIIGLKQRICWKALGFENSLFQKEQNLINLLEKFIGEIQFTSYKLAIISFLVSLFDNRVSFSYSLLLPVALTSIISQSSLGCSCFFSFSRIWNSELSTRSIAISSFFSAGGKTTSFSNVMSQTISFEGFAGTVGTVSCCYIIIDILFWFWCIFKIIH